MDDEEEEEASVGVGVSNETATERKKATRLTTFQSLRYSAVDTFRSSPHLDTRQGDRERERKIELVFLLLLRENEIDPLHSRLEENRNPRPPFTRQFSFILLTSLLHFLC